MAIGRVLAAARDFLYPPVCVACGEETGAPSGLCPACFADTPFLSPPLCARCGAPLEAGPGDDGALCDGCLHAPPAFDSARAAALYEGAARRAALALKHGDRLDVAAAAAPWMLRAGRALVEAADVIAPAPLHWTRLVARRFNQSAELARALAALAGRRDALAPDLLIRTRRTPSQDGRSRAARHENVRDAFRVRPSRLPRVDGARILLVDDVLTTGATLSACAEALRAAGAARVDALALARVARAAAPDYLPLERNGGAR
jgi:ComF family protein